MNAYCSKCHKRTDHRRTQFGSWYRFWCMVCGTELTGATENAYGVPGVLRRFDLPLDETATVFPPRGS